MPFDTNQPGIPQSSPNQDNFSYQSGQHPSTPNNPAFQPGPNPPSFPGSAPGYSYPQTNPPSFPGQLPGSTSGYSYQQANPPSFPDQQTILTSSAQPSLNEDKSAEMPRRNMLKMSALVGGSLVVGAGAALGGQQILAHSHALSTPSSNPGLGTAQTPGGQVREYWVQADSFHHNLVPGGKDGMMGMAFKPNQSSFWALGYRAYTPNWGKPLAGNDDIGPNTGIPGPIFRGSVGDTIHVHFRNNDTHYHLPHSMHPHGVLYTPANDGAWIASDPQPGAMVAPGQSYTYEWRVRPNSVGTWVYHDHSVSRTVGDNMLMEFGAEVGLFGFLVLTDASTKPATKEFFTFLHDLYQSDVSGLSQDYDCFNGFSYLGNTPTFQAKIGDTIRWHIGALGKEFHAFHLHGHRWNSNGQFVDVVQLGPSNALSFDFVADNPGKWLYHCHVTDHMMGGMIGMYVIS